MTFQPLEQALHEAIDWMLRLEHLPASDPAHLAFEHWHAHCAENRLAWQRVNGVLDSALANLQGLPGQAQVASRALRALANPPRRQLLGKGLALLLLGAGSVSVLNRLAPVADLLADARTATGERKTLQLADGSRLSLNARSAADIRFDTQQRRVVLRAGDLQVQVEPDLARPLIVATAHGEVRALGTRFMVRQESERCLVSVQQHSVLLSTADGSARRVEAGQAFAFDRRGSMAVAPSMRTRDDWVHGRIEARDEPLGELVEALRPYYGGLLRISPQAAQVRVFGTFLVDDIERTLASLGETLPIRVDTLGFWLTRIDVK
ncbi:FecR domain-containing protein [Pseudomonas sp. NPDC008258]|uniref:FecR domain-containing protein n=1 Tax=Pseudomonas sp. NPDC008258 TaxID=3364418 RepID=UPI0036F0A2B1